jgi:3-oxoacyl-(acyl-carrier-protein) synthase
VITGLGAVAPNGVGAAEQWKATLDRVSGLTRLPEHVAGNSGIHVAGIVADFDSAAFMPDGLKVQTDRWTWLCLTAGAMSLDDAACELGRVDADRLSVVTASSSGGNAFGQRELSALGTKGPRAVSAYQSIAWFYAAAAGQLSIRHGLRGPSGVTVGDGAGGLVAAAAAARTLRRDAASVVLIVGGEAPFSPYALACHRGRADLSSAADPVGSYHPFTRSADGGVLGEGAAGFVLERRETALERAATVYAELAAVASTHDAHHPLAPPPGPEALTAAMIRALRRAGVAPAEVDAVFADGNGTAAWDAVEAAALRQVFGRHGAAVPVVLPKTMTGRLNAGAAVLDVVWAARAVATGTLPPRAVGAGETAFDLDIVDSIRSVPDLATVLVVARGTGGFNSAAVLTSAERSS